MMQTIEEYRERYVRLGGNVMTIPSSADSEFEADGLLRSAAGAPDADESELMRIYATDPNDPDSSDQTVTEEDVWKRK